MTDSPTSSAGRLLCYAHEVLEGRHSFPPGQLTRAAAILGRQALENAVSERCRNYASGLDRATARSKLIVLSAFDADFGRPATFAWNRLSSACHHHAYELSPAHAEIEYLVQRVGELIRLHKTSSGSRSARH